MLPCQVGSIYCNKKLQHYGVSYVTVSQSEPALRAVGSSEGGLGTSHVAMEMEQATAHTTDTVPPGTVPAEISRNTQGEQVSGTHSSTTCTILRVVRASRICRSPKSWSRSPRVFHSRRHLSKMESQGTLLEQNTVLCVSQATSQGCSAVSLPESSG